MRQTPVSSALQEVRRRPIATLAALVGAIALAVFIVRGGYVAQHADQHDVSRAFIYAAAIAGAATMALLALRPWLGLLAWIVVMPLINVARSQVVVERFQFIPTTLLVAALAIGYLLATRDRMAAAGAGAGVDDGAWGLAWARRIRRWSIWAVAAFIVLSALSSAGSPGPFQSLTVATHGLIEPALVGLFVILLRPSREQIGWLVVAMAVSVTGAAFFNLVRMATLAHTLAELDAMRTQFARLTYFNVGLFGVMLTMALPLLGGIFLFRRSFPSPRLVAAAVAVAVFADVLALFVTLTKSAWISTFAAVVLLILLVAPTWRLRAGLVVAIVVLSALVVPWPAWLIRPVAPGVADGYLSVLTRIEGSSRVNSWDLSTISGEVSITERALATKAAFRMTVDHPILGVGPGRFALSYEGAYHDPGATRDLASAHDMLANTAAEYGLPVAILMVAAFVTALWAAWRVYRDGRRWDRSLAAALVAAIVGFLIVTATFGIDLYQQTRLMDSDVLFGALLVGAAIALRAAPARPAA